MNILVVGASKGTGALAVREACARDHRVTAFARHPENLDVDDPRVSRVQGDFHDARSVAAAVPGHDAVIVTASATGLKAFRDNPDYFTAGTDNVIASMKEEGVRRLVILSAIGVGASRALTGFVVDKLVIGWLMKVPMSDHERQEEHVMASGLEWAIARTGRLTDRPASGTYVATPVVEKVPSTISRADVASFLVDAATGDKWVNQAVQLGG